MRTGYGYVSAGCCRCSKDCASSIRFATTCLVQLHSSALRSVVDLLEFGYCGNTRTQAKVTEKENQHKVLRSLLLEAGWKDVKLWIFPLGTLGALHLSSLPSLVALGLTQATATKVLTKLSRHAVNAARAIVRKKRELEQELWSGHERQDGRQGVG